MTTCLGVRSVRFTAHAFRKLLSIYVFSYFLFGFECSIWDLIVSVPDHCLSFYFTTDVGTTYFFNPLVLSDVPIYFKVRHGLQKL